MSKLLVKLIPENSPGSEKEIGLNERKASDVQYSLEEKVLKVYLGPKKELTVDKVREKVSEANWKDISETEVELDANDLASDFAEAAYEMISLKSFVFDKYKSNPDERHVQIKKIAFKPKKPDGLEIALRDEIISAVKFCRDIVSSNADTINPGQMEKFANETATMSKYIKVKTIDADKAAKMGMECLIAVGNESWKNGGKDFHPRLVTLEYTGTEYKSDSKTENSKSKKKQQHIVLVGKGITFDTGGLCLKPNNYMLDMKSDMTGSAIVLSVFRALANLGNYLPKNIKITGIMALAENGFGASSYKPGDVLKALNGKTVEVVDTDAEGRLVLADALSYISHLTEPATQIMDFATLTGSMVSTLGEVAAGVMGTSDEMFDKVKKAFEKEGEKLWRMPLHEAYRKSLDSDIADMKHCNTRPDGLCAAMFLKEFVPENTPWLHFDIAGVGFLEADGLWAYKGASGFGVKGLLNYILNH
ncbi:MAG: leucyl aminopeptidase family protein [Candidatus Caenarcaniphilales bacterium]|jgi:leucyl aminopeptidase|nr:leucyl aminopeptidase family protein [Candidatus Caenarcaniphilales bacterium]